MNTEIEDFAAAVRASALQLPAVEDSAGLFTRRNYYQIPQGKLVIKISRSRKPFWGFGKAQIETLDGLGPYFIVFLVPSKEGWVFSRDETRRLIRPEGRWRLGKGQQYKVNWPMPDANYFRSPEEFLQKVRERAR